MSRGIGEFAVQELIPEWLAVVIALLTQLGDFWFLSLVLGTLYWTHAEKQDEIAVVVGLTLAGLGLYRGLKEVLALPRPDEPPLDPELLPWLIQPVWELTATAGGYGFPSGHATSSTLVYFGLATVLSVGTRRRRFAVAGLLVSIVGFSRVALGVHFLVDIVVGVVLGGLLLAVAFRLLGPLTARRATVVFALAVSTGGFYLVASDAELDAVVVLGAALGAFAGWQLVVLARELVALDRPSEAFRPLALRGGLAVLATTPLVIAVETFPLSPGVADGPPYAAGGTVGLAAIAVVSLPIARHSPRVCRATGVVGFYLRALLRGVRNRL